MYQNEIIKTTKPLSEEDIRQLEEQIGIAFPPVLKEHYLRYNGGRIADDKRVYQERDVEVGLKEFLSIRYPRYEGGLVLEYMYIKYVQKLQIIPSNFIPFAIDGGGFPFCFNIDDGTIYLCYLDESIDSPEGPMRYIAPSLSDFINKMKTAEEAYY